MPGNWAHHMHEDAPLVLGEPNRALSSTTELRYGTNGSLAIDLTAGTWFDHERQKGGGVLDLVADRTGVSNGGAVAWLRDHGVRIDDDKVSARGKIAAVYGYHNDDGQLAY